MNDTQQHIQQPTPYHPEKSMKRKLGMGAWVVALAVLLPSVALASPPKFFAEDAVSDLFPTPSLEPSQDDQDGSPQSQSQIVDPNNPNSIVKIDDENEAGPWYEDFSAFVDLSGSFGAATILSDTEFTQTDYFASVVAVGVNYTPIDEMTLTLSSSYTKFLTENGGSVFQREGRPGDTNLNVRWNGWQDKDYTKIRIQASASIALPTSDVSRATDRYARTALKGAVSRSFGGLNIAYKFRWDKNFHANTSILADPDELDLIARDGGAENVDGLIVAAGGVLPSFSFQNAFSLGFGFLQDFNAVIGLTYIDTFTYDNGTITQDDEFVNQNAVVGRGHSQLVVGSMTLGMSLNKYLSAYASVATVGQPLAADNRSLRFPFFDLENGQASRSDASIGMAASF